MPNPSRPDDLRCGYDEHDVWLCNADSRADSKTAPGVCRYCDLGTCSGCGGVMSPDECAVSRAECPVPHRNEVYCPTCLGEIKGDAVPVAVEEEQTVRAKYEPIGAEGLGDVRAERKAASL